ncbi:MAG TPA: hypothetical protein VF472_04370 [Burkholderiaceae bacterium]
MSSGRIGDRHVPTAEVPVAPPSQTGTGGESSRTSATGNATRASGVLGNLPQRRSGGTGGQRPTVVPAQMAQIILASVEADEKAVKAALKYGEVWEKLTGSARTTTAQRLDLAERGMQSARSGLKGLEGLDGKIGADQHADIKANLKVRLAQSAEYGVSVKADGVYQWSWKGAAPAGVSVQTHEELSAMSKALAELQDMRADIVERMAVPNQFIHECGQPGAHPTMLAQLPSMKAGVTRAKLALMSIAGHEILVNVDRLFMLCMRSGTPEARPLTERVMQLMQIMRSHRAGTKEAMTALESAAALPPELRSEYKARIAAFGEELNAAAEAFCLDAVAMPNTQENAPLWQSSLEMARALSSYQAGMRDAYELDMDEVQPEPRPETPPEQIDQPAAEKTASASSADAEAAPAKADKKASGKGKKLRGKKLAKPAHAGGGSTPAPVQKAQAKPAEAAPAARVDAAASTSSGLEKTGGSPAPAHDGVRGLIERTLKKSPLDYETAMRAGGDVAAIARIMGRSVRGIEAMRGPKCDPIDSAKAIRLQAHRWFGDTDRLRAASKAAAQSGTVEPGAIKELENRLKAMELVEQRIDTQQIDALKSHRYPRGKYISQLLKTDQIQEVGTPVRLRSDTESLYEIRIQPKPLSTGERVPPIFLHLHSNKSIRVEDLLKQPYRAFTAAHVKTNEQKNLGANYEKYAQITGELHRFEKVHRGDVTGDLFKDLRDWMAARS